MSPLFSVVLATYGRGRHILPTVQSVLLQKSRDFELLIVGDGCTDETERVVQPLLSDRVRWFNLEKRGASQSFPNNAGIAVSKGRYVAYIGHDDLWASDHLVELGRVFFEHPEVGLAVSGCILHPPPGAGIFSVTGLFDHDEAKFQHFFPPSSFAHRRELTSLIGEWNAPDTISAPVDCDLLLRAAHAGVQFRSTKKVTVHKFTSTHRYLSYVCQTSDEQERMLLRLQQPGSEQDVSAWVVEAQRQGRFMSDHYPDFTKFGKGNIHRVNLRHRGLSKPPLKRLRHRVEMKQTEERRGLDWKPLNPSAPRVRWSGMNPRPKILIPYTSRSRVRVALQVLHRRGSMHLRQIGFAMNGAPVNPRIRRGYKHGRLKESTVSFVCSLRHDDYSVLQVALPVTAAPDGVTRSIGVAEIRLEAIGWQARAASTVYGLGMRLGSILQPFSTVTSRMISALRVLRPGR